MQKPVRKIKAGQDTPSSKCLWLLSFRSSGRYLFLSLEKDLKKLNSYFQSISTVNDNNITLPDFASRTSSNLFEIVISKNEVCDVIKCLKLNKASGPDGISHLLLQRTVDSISGPLCLLFNLSLYNCVYPSMWKNANVMPLFKKGDCSLVSNYRPISLISCVGKLFERVVYKHLYNYFHVKN